MSRLRANKITNQLADGSPTVEKGLIIAGVTTVTTLDLNGDLDAQGNVSIADKIVHTGDTNTSIRFPSADTITFETAGSERLRIISGGSIGIGTDNPQQDVHILRSQLSRVRIESTSTTHNADVIFQNPDGLMGVVGYNAGLDTINIDSRGGTNGITFTRSGSEKLRITADGKLLVGSTTHNSTLASGVGSQLQIEGTTYATSGISMINNQTSTDPAFLTFGKSRAGSDGGTTVVQSGDRLGGIRFAGADGTDLHCYGAEINCYVDGTPGSNDMPGRIVFATTPDGAASPTTHEILYGTTKEIRNSGHYVAQTSGSGTSSQTASFGATQSGMAADSYNFILSGSNNVGNRCVLFVNGSNRSADGGTNGMTLRNDGGSLTLGNNSTRTTLRGDYVLYPERPAFHVTNFTWSNSTKFAHGGTATYNRGSHWNVSTGTFTAPVGGDYIMFCSVQVHAPNEISNRNATYSNLYAQKNGSNIGGEIVGTCQVGSYAFHGTITHSLVVYLAQNDTFRWNSSYGFRYGQNTLYGYLLG